jgi:hypothetical protein
MPLVKGSWVEESIIMHGRHTIVRLITDNDIIVYILAQSLGYFALTLEMCEALTEQDDAYEGYP